MKPTFKAGDIVRDKQYARMLFRVVSVRVTEVGGAVPKKLKGKWEWVTVEMIASPMSNLGKLLCSDAPVLTTYTLPATSVRKATKTETEAALKHFFKRIDLFTHTMAKNAAKLKETLTKLSQP